jgi:hypothetical protein
MSSDHRVILHLLAEGRISPAEAERLFVAGNEGRELVWMLFTCIAVAVLAQVHLRELLPGLLQLGRSLLPSAWLTLNHTLSVINQIRASLPSA